MLEAMLRCAGYRTGLYTSPHLVALQRARAHRRRAGRRRDAGRRVRRGRGCARADRPADAAHLLRVRHARGAVALRARGARRAGARGGARRAARRGQHRRRRRRGRDEHRSRSHRLPRPDARGHRPREGGIFRAGRAAVCADPDPPASRVEHARAIGAPLLSHRRDYGFVAEGGNGATAGRAGSATACRSRRCAARYQLANAATALAALDLLRDAPAGARRGGARRAGRASSCRAASRCCRDGRRSCSTSRTIRMRRARSPTRWATMGFHPQTTAVFGMLADKDIDGVIAAVGSRIDRWYVATLPGPRGATGDALRARSRRRRGRTGDPHVRRRRDGVPRRGRGRGRS